MRTDELSGRRRWVAAPVVSYGVPGTGHAIAAIGCRSGTSLVLLHPSGTKPTRE